MSFKGKFHREIWERVHAAKNPTRTTRKQRERILAVLQQAEKPLSQKEIAERANVPTPIVCRVLKHMLKELLVFRIGYKHEPHKPYRYVLDSRNLEKILEQHYRCPLCNGNKFSQLFHEIYCENENCKTRLFSFCLELIDPDDISNLLTKIATRSYTQDSPLLESEPNHTVDKRE